MGESSENTCSRKNRLCFSFTPVLRRISLHLIRVLVSRQYLGRIYFNVSFYYVCEIIRVEWAGGGGGPKKKKEGRSSAKESF